MKEDKTILIMKLVLQQINEFSSSDISRELGGILLGTKEESDVGIHISITAMLKAKKTAPDTNALAFTHETWNQVQYEKDILYPDLEIMGWFHTHPGSGVHMTDEDLLLQKTYFNLSSQITYVVDPVRQESGVFVWEGDQANAHAYRVVDNGHETLIALPGEDKPAKVTENIQEDKESVKSTAGYKVALVVMSLLLIITNLHRVGGSEAEDEQEAEVVYELEEELQEKEQQVETLLAELNHRDEKITSLESQISQLDERVSQLSGEYFHVYTVVPGDTLWSISDRYYNDPLEYQLLMRLNNVENPEGLEPGQTLLLYK